jgi:hypothetical protein
MDSLAKSNLADSIPPPLVGLVKVSPVYRFGMIVARAYPTFGGYARIVRLFSVRLFTTLHRGLSPPHVRGGFSVLVIDATRLRKTRGGLNKIGTPKINWPFYFNNNSGVSNSINISLTLDA